VVGIPSTIKTTSAASYRKCSYYFYIHKIKVKLLLYKLYTVFINYLEVWK